jgi:hypothetical protein
MAADTGLLSSAHGKHKRVIGRVYYLAGDPDRISPAHRETPPGYQFITLT